MLHLAPPLTGRGADVLAPPPARLVAGAAERHPADAVELEAALVELAGLDGLVERNELEIHRPTLCGPADRRQRRTRNRRCVAFGVCTVASGSPSRSSGAGGRPRRRRRPSSTSPAAGPSRCRAPDRSERQRRLGRGAGRTRTSTAGRVTRPHRRRYVPGASTSRRRAGARGGRRSSPGALRPAQPG